jgi:hypothetical protein
MVTSTLSRVDWKPLPKKGHFTVNGKTCSSFRECVAIVQLEGFQSMEYFINAWDGFIPVSERLFNFSKGV